MYDSLDDQLFQTFNNLNVNYKEPTLLITCVSTTRSRESIPDIAVSPRVHWILSSKGVTKQSAGKLPPSVFLSSRLNLKFSSWCRCRGHSFSS